MHSIEHTHAPRPAAVRLITASPSAVRTQRTNVSCGTAERQPTQVRTGTVSSGSGIRFVANLLGLGGDLGVTG